MYAIRGPNVSNEVCQLDMLKGLSCQSLPLMANLMGPPRSSPAVRSTPTIPMPSQPSRRHRFRTPAMVKAPSASSSSPASRHALRSLGLSRAQLLPIARQIVSEYSLNSDQQRVLNACIGWFDGSQPPVTLVHGTFGSGKSYLLVVLILFLVRVLQRHDPDNRVRVLVAAQTNVAGMECRMLISLVAFDYMRLTFACCVVCSGSRAARSSTV